MEMERVVGELQFRFMVTALRMEIRTARPDGSCLMMTSRKKAGSPLAYFRKMGFKARDKKAMLNKVLVWSECHGIEFNYLWDDESPSRSRVK